MGWAGGSFVANDLWNGLKDLIRDHDQEIAAQVIVDALEGNDWDTQDEAPELMVAAYGEKWWDR